MVLSPISLALLLARGHSAVRYAEKMQIPGIQFDHFGRWLGRALLWKGSRLGLGYLLHPVSITRYFEFDFAVECLQSSFLSGLDVSSPRLFSLYVALTRGPSTSITMANPHEADSATTLTAVQRLAIPNIHVIKADVEEALRAGRQYDAVWSISVIEHINEAYDDRQAVRWMYDSLAEGGRLILTFPVDRVHRDEFRTSDFYGRQAPTLRGSYFFQRFYDRDSAQGRLVDSIGREPDIARWFGETQPGRFDHYIRDWVQRGLQCAVQDPREIADYYREFASWDEMPGVGVCGLMIEKRDDQHSR